MNRRKKRALLFTLANTFTVIIVTIILIKSRKQQTKNQVAQPTEYVRGVNKVTSSVFEISKTSRRKTSRRNIWSTITKTLKFTSPIADIFSTIEQEQNTENTTELCKAIANKYILNQDITVQDNKGLVLSNSTHVVTSQQTVVPVTHQDTTETITNDVIDTTPDAIHDIQGTKGICMN